MSNSVANSEVEDNLASETSKQTLADKVYNEITSDKEACDEILSRVKWSLDFQKTKGNKIPWSFEATTERISGNLIGFVAENVSEKVSLSEAETVFNPNSVSLDSLKVISPQKFAGSKGTRKGDVLSHMVKKSLEEKPLRVFDPNVRLKNNPIIEKFKEERKESKAKQVPSQEYGKLLKEYISNSKREMEQDILEGYTYGQVREKGGSVTPAGEFFDQTSIPDGIVVKGEQSVGVFEVKAYSPEELDRAMTLIRNSDRPATYYKGSASEFGKQYPGADIEEYSIGADIDKEVAFVDILRGLSGNEDIRGADNLVLLRFPNDIPNNLLTQYGEMLVSFGYPNVVIQKLPFSREELSIIAKEVIKSRWQKINLQLLEKKNFSDRDLAVLHKYAYNEV